VNPIDLLECTVLADRISDDLRTMRIGLKSLRRNWQTSRAGLLPSARAAYSLKVLTEECYLLLSYMATNGGEPSQETPTPHSSRSATSSVILKRDIENRG